jgi:hypothetical protein
MLNKKNQEQTFEIKLTTYVDLNKGRIVVINLIIQHFTLVPSYFHLKD